MRDIILNFPSQFSWEPVIENSSTLKRAERFVIAGMGGSALVGGILKMRGMNSRIKLHRNYGLPVLDDAVYASSLVILCSYSGNTEETLDAFREALTKKYSCAVITTGGALLAMAKEHGVPYIQLPSTGIQPRVALGYITKAQLKLMGYEEDLKEVSSLATSLDAAGYEAEGRALAEKLEGKVPVVYASTHNKHLAYDWKIKLNETGKTPAFFNIFPELNHNEMTGFDSNERTKELSRQFHFIFLKSKNDHPRILKRMEVSERLFRDRGFGVEVVEFGSQDGWHDIFHLLLIADWTALTLAERYGAEPTLVPMVEEFKTLI